MKKSLIGLSLASIVLSSNPAMAMKPQVERNQVSKSEILKSIFAAGSAIESEQEMQAHVANMALTLDKNNISIDEVVNFMSADMSVNQKARFDQALAPFLNEDLNDLENSEKEVLLAELALSLSTGSHFFSCDTNGQDNLALFASSALFAAVIALGTGYNKKSNAEERVDNRNLEILQNELNISILIDEGVQADSFLINEIEAENTLLRAKNSLEKEEIKNGKVAMAVGYGALAVSASLGLKLMSCR